MSEHELHHWLAKFSLDEWLRAHVALVMNRLPVGVREDFTGDPGFCVADYEPGPGVVVRLNLEDREDLGDESVQQPPTASGCRESPRFGDMLRNRKESLVRIPT